MNLSDIACLVDATLNSLDDAILPSANWVLQLQDAREELKAATGIEVTHLDICTFQQRLGKPFIRLIKDNISSWFRSFLKDVSAFSIFDSKKVPNLSTHMETVQFKLLAAMVSSDLSTEWKTYRQLLIKQPKYDISKQLKKLLTHDIFSNLYKLATICSSIPTSTASVEQSCSDTKNRLGNC